MYVCALRPRGEPLTRGDVFGYMARLKRGREDALHSIVEGPFAAIALAPAQQQRPRLGRWRGLIGVGDVRLDNRAEIAALARVDAAELTDIEIVLAAVDATGEASIARLLGDFAFVVWDARAQKLMAVRDAFGVKPLFHRADSDLVLFASEVAPLQRDEAYDNSYIATYLSGQTAPQERTIWHDISSVRAGSIVRQRGTVQAQERYWRAEEFVPEPDGDVAANCFRFRELLEEAVRVRVERPGETWAQLSGGLDSSSVVAFANLLRSPAQRVAGTITVVDSLGDGDERVYSDAVVQRYQLANEQVRDYWAWQADGEPPPVTDQPSGVYPFFARDRRLWNIVRNAGGRVLLSGLGADHYLYGSLDYITDLAATGHVGAAVREATTWAVATRQSFWKVGRRYLVDPFVHSGPARARSPRWLTPTAAAQLIPPARQRPRRGLRFAYRIAEDLQSLPAWFQRWPFGDEVEMRYPFLYRPLVEWSLRLPATQRVRPHARKWILREATRDVLPESVRTRATKGGIDARILWSLQRERTRIDALLRDPMLAQLGCIDPAVLRTAVEQARCGIPVNNVLLFSALALETWLAVRNGQWPVLEEAAAATAA
ncbi:MAG TPA: asparagine synthase-related protein [Longimicrobiales bacterium]|nr:asparagine synthase-related protein [Longimicrobiales bacterium]